MVTSFFPMPAVVAVHCSEDASGWHSNPFVAKESCVFFAFDLVMQTLSFVMIQRHNKLHTDQAASMCQIVPVVNLMGTCSLIWIREKGQHFNCPARNGIESGKAMPCLHGVSHCTNGQ